MKTIGGAPAWLSWLAGASAGIFVIGFLAVPWPADLGVIPLLVICSIALSGLSRPRGWKRPGHVLVLAGFTALVLTGLMIALLRIS